MKHFEPRRFEEAVKHLEWISAMQDEISSLEQNQVWKIVPLLKNKKPIGCRWVS